MVTEQKIVGTAEAWESGDLGRSREDAVRVSKEVANAMDDAFGLKSISIRLQQTLIDDLKIIADANGLGYQPLIRTLLTRFAQSELRRMAQDRAIEMAKTNRNEGQFAVELELPEMNDVNLNRFVA